MWWTRKRAESELVEISRSLRVAVEQIRNEWNSERSNIRRLEKKVANLTEELRKLATKTDNQYHSAYARSAERYYESASADQKRGAQGNARALEMPSR